jgi:hypothetical protein
MERLSRVHECVTEERAMGAGARRTMKTMAVVLMPATILER